MGGWAALLTRFPETWDEGSNPLPSARASGPDSKYELTNLRRNDVS